MNKTKVEKLRKKFIWVASLSFFVVMLLMGGMMYLTSLIATRSEIHDVMDYIIQNDGDLSRGARREDIIIKMTSDDMEPPNEEYSSEGGADTNLPAAGESEEERVVHSLRKYFGIRDLISESAEFFYSTRYFAVLFDEDMHVEAVKTGHIAGVDREEAENYAQIALKQPLKFGSFDEYYYQVAKRPAGGTIVIYLESIRQMNAINLLLYTALSLIGLGSIVTIILMRILSRKVVKQELKSIEMQESFMTNASHELKTPLAVIKANTEVEQMLNGENEWNQSTMRQVERMTGLIQNLIRIVRAEEQESVEPMKPLDISSVVQETADTFRPVATQDGKNLNCEIETAVMLNMREADIRQLTSLLLDNAIKYCDENGTILVGLKGKGKTVHLFVSNSYAEGANTDYSRFFERFYRKDESHNVDKGGYGIGLSIAESLVEKYKGSISVGWKNGIISFTCVLRRIGKHTSES